MTITEGAALPKLGTGPWFLCSSAELGIQNFHVISRHESESEAREACQENIDSTRARYWVLLDCSYIEATATWELTWPMLRIPYTDRPMA